MRANLSRPCFDERPIGSISALARKLGCNRRDLVRIARRADHLYRPGKPVVKEDGSIRRTYDARPPLKRIQRRILERLLRKVNYPMYLQGGIRDETSPRSYIRDAARHAGKRIVITEDITAFFPSIKAPLVFNIWKHVFNFPDEVADCLTKLTTRRGEVPQGSSTSSYLANLVFWNCEAKVHNRLAHQGIEYGRFIDDITLSSEHKLSNRTKSAAISTVIGMMAAKGLRPKRPKHKIQPNSGVMEVHGLNVNAAHPTVPRWKRANLRALVHRLEALSGESRYTDEYRKLFQSASVRVGQLKQMHPHEAHRLAARLRRVRPARLDQE